MTDSSQSLRAKRQLIESALGSFADVGFEKTTMRTIAERANVPLGTCHRLFPRKTDFVVALYNRITDDVEAVLVDLPDGSIGTRFAFIMRAKLTAIRPHRTTLTSLLATLFQTSTNVGVFSTGTDVVRSRMLSVFGAVVAGATDSPERATTETLTRQLYAVHLLILLTWLQDVSGEGAATLDTLDAFAAMIDMGASMVQAGIGVDLMRRLDTSLGFLSGRALDRSSGAVDTIARRILRDRRLDEAGHSCGLEPCKLCLALLRPRLEYFMTRDASIQFAIAGFPAKSPNLSVVLGELPDLGEELGLRNLQALCDDIATLYAPGANVVICSDGHVFADIVGVSDAAVDSYGEALQAASQALPAPALYFFDLLDASSEQSEPERRTALLARYAADTATIKERAAREPSHRRQLDGMQRFLFEDLVAVAKQDGTAVSRTQLRKRAGDVALEVVRRSDAWSRIIADCFPAAVRLSIHPQPAHGSKIGYSLTAAADNWMTPWHGVAVLTGDGFTLMKRHEAEQLGARLVMANGRPSHFELVETNGN